MSKHVLNTRLSRLRGKEAARGDELPDLVGVGRCNGQAAMSLGEPSAIRAVGPADVVDTQSDAEIEALYEAHAAELSRRLSRHTRCPEAAHDLTQESFVRLLALPCNDRAGIARPDSYLRRIAGNLLRDWGRAQAFRRTAAPASDEAYGAFDQVALLESRDTLRRLEAAMLKLKPRTREIFMAHRFDGMSYAEIAERTGLSISGVEKQMSKAIAMIDRMLDRS